MLLVLLVRGVTLDGAMDGVVYYLKPDLERLKDVQVRTFSIQASDNWSLCDFNCRVLKRLTTGGDLTYLCSVQRACIGAITYGFQLLSYNRFTVTFQQACVPSVGF